MSGLPSLEYRQYNQITTVLKEIRRNNKVDRINGVILTSQYDKIITKATK